ncbi:Elongation factor Ts [Buchnera aphidicola (Tetraneura ulmi)]|uniref:translation elongation factor Ts n=1 Tax=Buchnera aphidicola TaxID=9 RepID=UPI003464B71D
MVVKNLLKLIKDLRNRTGASLVECKKSLLLFNGDIELAIDHLRKLGIDRSLNKSSNLALEGSIFLYRKKNIAGILELNCETDFVSKNRLFVDFGNLIVKTAVLEHIKDINQIIKKFEKFRLELISKFSENILFRKFFLLEGFDVRDYLHLNRIGVLVDFNKCNKKRLGKEIAMHITASKPKFLSKDSVPFSIFDRERKIQFDLASSLGKSIEITNKIVSGRMNKFFKEIVLLEQNFIFDDQVTVSDYLNKNNSLINSFVRFEVGDTY